MSDAFSIDTQAASKAGQNLTNMSNTLKNGRTYGSATGAEEYDVYEAVDTFTDKWDNALTRLQKSIGDIGETVVEIAKAYDEHDRERSKIFQCEKQSSPGGPQKPC